MPVEMTLSVKTSIDEADGFVCHFASSKRTLLFICSSALTGKMENRDSVCGWQDHSKVTRRAVSPRFLVISSLQAQFFILSIPEVLNGKWLEKPPIHKDLLDPLLGIYDMQNTGSKSVKKLLVLFCSLSNFEITAQ